MSTLKPLLHRPLVALSVLGLACINVNGVTGSATESDTGESATTEEKTTGGSTTGGCTEGSAGCSCYGNATCNDGLVCTEFSVCVPEDCADGTEGCPCYGNATCDDGLECSMDNICKPPSGDTTGGTTGNSTTGTTDGTTGDTGVDTTGDTAGDATSDSTGRTTGDTTGDTTGNTTGDVDPGCDGVPEDMACIPANTFEMGSDLDNFNNAPIDPWEKPAHTVTVSSTFWIDLTEVTVEAYALCWAAQVCALPKQGQLLNWGVAGKEKHPANGVHWYQAKQYCEWKGKRLPTEAEWELAARGVDGRMYPWGNEIPTCDHVHGNECAPDGTGEVATKPMGDSPYGVHDMAGNVAEWTSDYYKADYYYESPQVDPKGPVTGTTRSVRSIGVFVYKSDTGLQRATYRVGWSPLGDNTNPAVMGFRCAQTPP